MSKAILFAPHGDDETLFAFYTMLREKPHVVIVLWAGSERSFETAMVMDIVKPPSWEQWSFPEEKPDWTRIEQQIQEAVVGYDKIIGPAFEFGGHEHHNMLAGLLDDYRNGHFAHKRYLTYRRGYGRSMNGVPVIPTVEEKATKIEALNCYRSQRLRADTAVWFGDDQREFIQ